MYEAAMDVIKEHYFRELEPELKKIKVLKTFCEKATPDNIKKNYKDRSFNDILYQCVGENNENYVKQLKPDIDKINLFFKFFEDRIWALQDFGKRFLKTLLPNFL